MRNYEIIEKLRNAKKIIVTISDYGYSKTYRARFPYLNIYVEEKDDRICPVVDPNSSYWDKRKNAYAMSIFESDRVFELIYSLCSDCVEANKLCDKVYKLF